MDPDELTSHLHKESQTLEDRDAYATDDEELDSIDEGFTIENRIDQLDPELRDRINFKKRDRATFEDLYDEYVPFSHRSTGHEMNSNDVTESEPIEQFDFPPLEQLVFSMGWDVFSKDPSVNIKIRVTVPTADYFFALFSQFEWEWAEGLLDVLLDPVPPSVAYFDGLKSDPKGLSDYWAVYFIKMVQ